MSNTVTICEDALDPSTWQKYEDIGDVRNFLMDHFGVWPDTARIYLDHVSQKSDITPSDEAGVERLGKVNGDFFVVVYPAAIATILLIVALVVAAVAIALVFLFRPSVKKPQNEDSANNQLANRTNQARPLERIPDIYGQLWATFDLLAVPYRTFESNVEFEHCYMCIGRGQYQMNAADIRDDITPAQQEQGNSVQVYGPGLNPNLGSAPDIQIGAVIGERVKNLQVFGSVNGQILRAPNLGTVIGNNNIRFVSPNLIQTNDPNIDFTKNFSIGDVLTVGGLNANDALAVDSGGIQPSVDLSVQATINGISASQISLTNPAASNANWSALAAFAGGHSTYRSIDLIANGAFTVPQLTSTIPGFVILNPSMQEIWCNFVAQQGLYTIDTKGRQYGGYAVIWVYVTQCDSTGAPIANTTLIHKIQLQGTSTDKLPKGSTLKITISPVLGFGGVIIYAKRNSPTYIRKGVTVVDEVQWRDCYIVSDPGNIDFGNVTTVQTKTQATLSATSVKERKLNALVTRKLPQWTGVGTAFGAPTATKNAADIICAMALDPFIGDRVVSELDLVNIYGVAGPAGAIETYFGSTNFDEFCYTFDDSKVSFEESLADLAQAIFCVAYRRGNVLSLSFEKPTNNSVILFNHRNKVPKSETRTVTFGSADDNDGINLDYVEPNAPNYPNLDTMVTLYFPPNQSAKNPKKVTAIGVRNKAQALALGFRLYNKILYQNTVVEFESTEEAALLVLQDRISVADNTRSDTQDGEVLDQVGLLLTLSQKVTFDGVSTYSIYLQDEDGTVDVIGITPGPNPNQVVLASPPTNPCSFDPDNFARTTYMIVSSIPTRASAFLLTEKSPKDGKLYSVKAVNYAPEYYQDDFTGSTAIGGFCLFMPTTNGTIVPTGGDPTWGAATVGSSYGELDQWISGSLRFWNVNLFWDFLSGSPMYGVPGFDNVAAPVRSRINKIYAVAICQQTYTWFCRVHWNIGGVGAFGGPGVTPPLGAAQSATRYVVDITAALIAHYGSIAAIDFTQLVLSADIATSLNFGIAPPGNQFQIFQTGLEICFDGGTDPGTALSGLGTPPTPTTAGYILNPSNPLYQIDPTHIGMVKTDVVYLPSGNQGTFNARSWAIADPGATPQVYYVGIFDPSQIGDSGGTLTDLIGTTPASVNQGVAGWVTIGPILAIHGSSQPPPNGGSGSGGTPATGNTDGGTIFRFLVTNSGHGDFTFAHGLGVIPIDAKILSISDGEIRFQAAPSPPWDGTTVYLNSSDDGISCVLEMEV
jgi:hypothetical protein